MKKPKSQRRFKKYDPRSEAAQREACRLLKSGDAHRYFSLGETFTVHVAELNKDPIAIFDLRDCYRKRQPLKGIKKAFNKAIAPKRKKAKGAR